MTETPLESNGQPRDRNGNPIHGLKGHSGPAKGNRNAMRHGLRGGQLPENCKYIEIRLNSFRRQLEDAVMAVRDEVTLLDAANIQTCLRWERHGCLCQRWLNKDFNELKPLERLHFSREVARASAERDKSLSMLQLDKKEQANLQTYLVGEDVK